MGEVTHVRRWSGEGRGAWGAGSGSGRARGSRLCAEEAGQRARRAPNPSPLWPKAMQEVRQRLPWRGSCWRMSWSSWSSVGSVPQVDAVVLGCSRGTFFFVRMLAGKPEAKVLDPAGESSNSLGTVKS